MNVEVWKLLIIIIKKIEIKEKIIENFNYDDFINENNKENDKIMLIIIIMNLIIKKKKMLLIINKMKII